MNNKLILSVLIGVIIVGGLGYFLFFGPKKIKEPTMIIDDRVQVYQELGLNKNEIAEYVALEDAFMSANEAFYAKEEELYEKYPQQYGEFVAAVSNALLNDTFDDKIPAITALMHEPVIASYVAAWKNVFTKREELANKYPLFKEQVELERSELIDELNEELAENEEN